MIMPPHDSVDCYDDSQSNKVCNHFQAILEANSKDRLAQKADFNLEGNKNIIGPLDGVRTVAKNRYDENVSNVNQTVNENHFMSTSDWFMDLNR